MAWRGLNSLPGVKYFTPLRVLHGIMYALRLDRMSRQGDHVAVHCSQVLFGGNVMDQVSSEYSQNQDAVARSATFEETYPRYEFAEMVRIGLVLAEWLAAGAGRLARLRRRAQEARFGMPDRRSAGEMPPAE